VLIPAAVVACGLLWLGAMTVAGSQLRGSGLIALGVAGLLLFGALLLLIQSQHKRLVSLAATDALTGLANHRCFHETLGFEIERAGELGRPVALVTLDLDNFKAVNDTHGHPYGDTVLSSVGSALRAAIRANDTAARVGGEEFALVLPGTDAETAFAVAERARHNIAAIGVRGLELSCSAGIAAFPADADDPSALCQLADSALYWAKRGGKRRTRRFDPDHSPATWSGRQRAEIEALLAQAQPIHPVFQPVVSLANGRIVGYEALARFPGSSRRAPDVWVAQAHGCGLGPELEAAAISAALEPIGRPFDTHLAINVSPSALSTPIVQRTLSGSLEGIVVEITEHEFVPDDDSIQEAVADLRERGARIAIDDAGAGHAGLKQLMRVRPDIVKLDQALIRDIQTDPARMALVESFVRFARDVGATVCAEGIESLDELAVIADLDVQWGQGYALARPSEPWAGVDRTAAELCRTALAETFRSLPAEGHPVGASDRRLVHLSARLAGVRTRADLESTLTLIAAELGASQVALSAWHAEAAALETLAETGEPEEQRLFAIDEYPLSARVLREQEAVQVVVGDPDSDPSEVELLLALGERSLLMVPVVCRGESLGLIEAYRADERAWTRAEINRARVVANQFASVIPTLVAERSPRAVIELKASAGRGTRA
jgi:diguanylate cyclase (GGDEF)-like protein